MTQKFYKSTWFAEEGSIEIETDGHVIHMLSWPATLTKREAETALRALMRAAAEASPPRNLMN